jgi:hypothetical protein
VSLLPPSNGIAPDGTIGRENLVVGGRVKIPATSPEVNKSGNGYDNGSAGDGGESDREEFIVRGIGFRRVRENEGGDVGRERSKGEWRRRRRRGRDRRVVWEKW